MAPITVCFTYYRSLDLANFEAALYSISKQNLSRVESIVIVDNNTDDSLLDLLKIIEGLKFPVPINLHSFKHGDVTKTHSWSTNVAVSKVFTPWVLFARADYLLDFGAVEAFADVIDAKPVGWEGFIVSGYYDVGLNIYSCEQVGWRALGPAALKPHGREYDHVTIDAGVWMTRKATFDRIGGLDESQTAWGHAQTVFQHKVHQSGVEFVRISDVLFYHVAHAYETPRDHAVATTQLHDVGFNISELWARYEGPDNPYPKAAQ